MDSDQIRTYERSQSVVFLKTNEVFGGLSNMAGGYPIKVNGLRIFTSEALYQACRFPHLPEVQRLIIGQISPMTAKMKSKKYRPDSRSDWDQVRVKIMRWSLRVKLAQNWDKFSKLLLDTEDRPIVEHSHKDDFWGAKPIDEHTLVGMNVLGRLLMELRELVKTSDQDSLRQVEPLAIPDFLLDGRPIQIVSALAYKKGEAIERGKQWSRISKTALQEPLFGQPLKTSSAPYESEDQPRVKAFAELKSYPEYNDSGVPWLGKLPRHWKLERAKWLFQKMDRPVGPHDEVVTCFRDGVVTLRRNRRLSGFTESLKEIGYQGVRKGDLVIHAMDAFAGAIGVSDSDGKCTPVYSICRPQKGINPYYYAHVVREMSRSQWIVALARGIRERSTDFRYEGFANQIVPIPPKEEQDNIAAFLNHTDRHIRRYIAVKRKLITLLNEQKQAIVHNAVTRGLDPNVQLKSSGMEWLGNIPKHWEIARLKDLSPRISGRLVYQPAQYFCDEGIPFIMGNNVTSRGIRWTGVKYIPPDINDRFAHHALRENDVITVRVGAPGVTCVVPKEADGLNCGSLMIIRRSANFNSQWLAYMMNSRVIRPQIALVQYGAAQEQINIEDAKNFLLPVPPLEEQEQIANTLSRVMEPIDQAVECCERLVARAREYRTCLVADVVTGKLDVRAAAARLAEEIAVEELLNEDMVLNDEDEMIEIEEA